MPKKTTEITTRTTSFVTLDEIRAVLREAYGERFSSVQFDLEIVGEYDADETIDVRFNGARIITEKTEKS